LERPIWLRLSPEAAEAAAATPTLFETALSSQTLLAAAAYSALAAEYCALSLRREAKAEGSNKRPVSSMATSDRRTPGCVSTLEKRSEDENRRITAPEVTRVYDVAAVGNVAAAHCSWLSPRHALLNSGD